MPFDYKDGVFNIPENEFNEFEERDIYVPWSVDLRVGGVVNLSAVGYDGYYAVNKIEELGEDRSHCKVTVQKVANVKDVDEARKGFDGIPVSFSDEMIERFSTPAMEMAEQLVPPPEKDLRIHRDGTVMEGMRSAKTHEAAKRAVTKFLREQSCLGMFMDPPKPVYAPYIPLQISESPFASPDGWNGDLLLSSRQQREEGPRIKKEKLHEYFNQIVIEFDGERIESPAPPGGFECYAAQSFGPYPIRVLDYCADSAISESIVDLRRFVGIDDSGACWAHDWLCDARVKNGLYLVQKRQFERVTER